MATITTMTGLVKRYFILKNQLKKDLWKEMYLTN